MNTTAHESRAPGRPRKETEREDRRRRSFGVQGIGRLGVDPSLLDHNKFAYRWFNDEPGRLVAKTKHDDWDMVSNVGEKEDSTDLGEKISIVVGTMPDGSPKRAYLCRKLKTYFDEDRATAQAALDEQMNQLRRGADRGGQLQSDYVPKSGINLGA